MTQVIPVERYKSKPWVWIRILFFLLLASSFSFEHRNIFCFFNIGHPVHTRLLPPTQAGGRKYPEFLLLLLFSRAQLNIIWSLPSGLSLRTYHPQLEREREKDQICDVQLLDKCHILTCVMQKIDGKMYFINTTNSALQDPTGWH